MKRLIVFLFLAVLLLSACSHESAGLDKNSETYKHLMQAVNGSDWTPEPTEDPKEANIRAFAAAVNRFDPITDYKKYARNPEDYKGDQISFEAEVVRMDGSLGLFYIVAMDGDIKQLFRIHNADQQLLAGDLVSISGYFMGEDMVKEIDGSYNYYPVCSVHELKILN